MKPLPPSVLAVLATVPDDKPCKIILNTNGQGHWEVEIFARYICEEAPAEIQRLDGFLTHSIHASTYGRP